MESRQPGLWAAALTTYIAALVAFILRLVARRLKRVALTYDDYTALVAFLCTTGFTVVTIEKIKHGLGLHLEDINRPYNQLEADYFRILWIDSWFYTFSIGLSKLAVLVFYWRIFGHSSIKIPIQVLIACVIGWIIARVVVIPLQCVPIAKFWDGNVAGHCPVKTNLFFFGATFPHLFMEVAIIVLPLVKICELNLPKFQKIAVGGMFMSGAIVCVCSVAQLIQAFELDTNSKDLWWNGAPQIECAVIEVNLGHFSSSLPNLRPIFDLIKRNGHLTSSGRTPIYGESIAAVRGTEKSAPAQMKPVGQVGNESTIELTPLAGNVAEGRRS